MVMMKSYRKAGVPMEKQRMLKMSQLEQDMLVKALCDTQSDVQPEQAGNAFPCCENRPCSPPQAVPER